METNSSMSETVEAIDTITKLLHSRGSPRGELHVSSYSELSSSGYQIRIFLLVAVVFIEVWIRDNWITIYSQVSTSPPTVSELEQRYAADRPIQTSVLRGATSRLGIWRVYPETPT